MEARSQVLDVAAFLDRLDRARECEGEGKGVPDDFRYHDFRADACGGVWDSALQLDVPESEGGRRPGLDA